MISEMNLEHLDHPNYQFQVMGEAAYSPKGIRQLEELGATEVIVALEIPMKVGLMKELLRR